MECCIGLEHRQRAAILPHVTSLVCGHLSEASADLFDDVMGGDGFGTQSGI